MSNINISALIKNQKAMRYLGNLTIYIKKKRKEHINVVSSKNLVQNMKILKFFLRHLNISLHFDHYIKYFRVILSNPLWEQLWHKMSQMYMTLIFMVTFVATFLKISNKMYSFSCCSVCQSFLYNISEEFYLLWLKILRV